MKSVRDPCPWSYHVVHKVCGEFDICTYQYLINSLQIERGRRTNPVTPRDQRLCNVCHVLQDESHFLLQCKMFTDERTAFLSQFQNKYFQFTFFDNTEKLSFLLHNGDTQNITRLNSFIVPWKRNNWIHHQLWSAAICDNYMKWVHSTGYHL